MPGVKLIRVRKTSSLVSRIVEHIEIKEHQVKFPEKLIAEHLFYTLSIQQIKEHMGYFSLHNSQTRLAIRDTGVAVYWIDALGLSTRQVSNIRRTKSQHLKDSPPVLWLSLSNPLKPDVKSRMKM